MAVLHAQKTANPMNNGIASDGVRTGAEVVEWTAWTATMQSQQHSALCYTPNPRTTWHGELQKCPIATEYCWSLQDPVFTAHWSPVHSQRGTRTGVHLSTGEKDEYPTKREVYIQWFPFIDERCLCHNQMPLLNLPVTAALTS